MASAHLHRPAVLVVDDEEDLRRILSNILRKKGFEVFDAEDGKKGLEIFEAFQHKIGYILADINMPELNGKELAAEIRKLDVSVKIILISGDYSLAEVDNFSKEKALQFMAKPFRIDELLKAMGLR
ncbi:response regulator receiver protein [Chloroherpeton thalassium ATCC 35110]|uniref:Response regulator receiver protein n=1 Tax=Chloroherpeton thalassium (strain ATCC 35110 / GB-78) TaxID=517418 RepID=B3QSP4_CHLT3|nr:response regulator [Chloroherpeton thalassium]ACF14091.1 response regulator receiver protein [Chloroherpeton thalassium ATCC 35110]